MRYFYCAKCERAVESARGEHFQTHGYSLSEAFQARLATSITERDYKRLTVADLRRKAKLQAYEYRVKHLLEEHTAWVILMGVWEKLKEEKLEEMPYLQRLWMPPIKAGQCKDRRFYRALQTVLLSKHNHNVSSGKPPIVVVAGAPSHICESEGLFFSEGEGRPLRLWVYFNVEDEKAAKAILRGE